MIKDSEVVKEVENFLKEKNITILEMEYHRDLEHDLKPTFDVLTNDLKSLEKLASEVKAEFLSSYDTRSYWKAMSVENDKYKIYICHRGKPFHRR